MPTMAVVGAGPGLGQAIAVRFAREGFDIALVARNQAKLAQVRDAVKTNGTAVETFRADVTDRAQLAQSLGDAASRLGPIDVLEFSPSPAPDAAARDAVNAIDLSVAAVGPEIDFYLYGGITAIQSVLPAMRDRDDGTILVSTGASSGPVVYPPFGNIAAASGALRNWVLNLHEATKGSGVYVAHVALATNVGSGEPGSAPEEIAEAYWRLYRRRTDPELFYSPTGSSS